MAKAVTSTTECCDYDHARAGRGEMKWGARSPRLPPLLTRRVRATPQAYCCGGASVATKPRSVRIFGAGSSIANRLWQVLQSCGIVRPSALVCWLS